ncbi:hypothetical protein C0992_012646 [Termitomyces sp. T32_za158]|nr:hypothetical protein C0992_012646 [Termitomyces sp. T32_za158]
MSISSKEGSTLLPSKTASVAELLKWISPIILTKSSYNNPAEYFSDESPTVASSDMLCCPIPPQHLRLALKNHIQMNDNKDAIKSIVCPHDLHSNGARYPLSTLQYWEDVVDLQYYQEKWKLAEKILSSKVILMNPLQFATLNFVYRNPEQYKGKAYNWLRNIAENLVTGISDRLGCVMNKDGTHWTAFVLDFWNKQIMYGDSQQNPIANEALRCIEWWINQHTNDSFTVIDLPISRQFDSYSCGILAENALAHELLGVEQTLIDPSPISMALRRAEVLLEIIQRHQIESVSNISQETLKNQGDTYTSSSPLSTFTPTLLVDGCGNDYASSESYITEDDELPESTAVNHKRAYVLQEIHTPSPKNKKPRILDVPLNLEKPNELGLLAFFKPVSAEVYAMQVSRDMEALQKRREDIDWEAKKKLYKQSKKERKNATQRKRAQRERERLLEIQEGL